MSASFIDSNVFIYLFDESNLRKRRIAEDLVTRALDTGDAVTSFQVVQETLSAITRKSSVRVTAEEASSFFTSTLARLWKVSPSRELYQSALTVHSRYKYGFYDSLIIAAAMEAGCSKLCSEDMQHGQVIEGMIIQNPFMENA